MKVFLFITVLAVFGCKNSEEAFEDKYIWDSRTVTATAYNSLAYQTNSNPNITAFGDSLKPGLKNNIPVKIDGLEGIYLVKDKMHSRWRNRIDIYMGVDVNAAKRWGKKKVCIEFGLPKGK